MRDAMVPELDRCGVYIQDLDGEWHFSFDRFADYLSRHGIEWPRTEAGRLSIKSKTFDDMTRGHPQLEDLRQLKHMRDKMRTVRLAVGPDG